MRYLSDKDKVSLGEAIFRKITSMEDVRLRWFNGINLGYYLTENIREVESLRNKKLLKSIASDLTSFHIYH